MTEVVDKTLEADSFSPSNVPLTLQSPPAKDEPPGSLSALDDDPNPDARACIRVCAEIK